MDSLHCDEQSFDANVTCSRADLRQQFLSTTQWEHWSIQPLTADASFRRYFRLSQGADSILLMDSPPDTEDMGSYLKVGGYLLETGLRAPRVLAVDEAHGFAVIEDFGTQTYTNLLDKGVAAEPLYRLATDVLSVLHRNLSVEQLDIPRYDDGYYEEEAALYVDWYWQARAGEKISADLRAEFLEIWSQLLAKISCKNECMVMRDYHVDNLMLLDGESGIDSCGLLDFQDALIGSRAYDLVSLFEDARRDVDAEMTKHLLGGYLQEFSASEREAFQYDYQVLGAHRHTKVVGIFVRLCVRDGKAHYLNYLPRVQRLLGASLLHPELKPLTDWLTKNHPGSVEAPLQFNPDTLHAKLCN